MKDVRQTTAHWSWRDKSTTLFAPFAKEISDEIETEYILYSTSHVGKF